MARALLLVAAASCFVLAAATPAKTNCLLKSNVTDEQANNAIAWACTEGGLDCAPIQPGGAYYNPNTPQGHASWVVNTYFWLHPESATSCDFGGIAELSCPNLPTWKIRGVDIGGFLVLEPWIRPSLFEQFRNRTANETATDEYSFCELLGPVEAERQLTKHWNEWVTEEIIEQLASFGLNTLRVPVGYWIVGNTPPFVDGGLAQLDRVVGLAAKYNLSVIVDLHGAPGSQNGFDNSGRACGACAGICPAAPVWATTPVFIEQTISVLGQLASRYANSSSVMGIELLNEPRWDVEVATLKEFYINAYKTIRAVAPNMKIFMHDAFRYNIWYPGFMTPSQGYTEVYMDTHIYESFSQSDIMQTEAAHLSEACGYHTMIDWVSCMVLPVVTGEWSLGTSDCPEWLLGFEKEPTAPSYGVPCPHNNSDAFYQQYAAKQMATFERGLGWIFWNFRTETNPDWDYMEAVKRGWIPPLVTPLPANIASSCQ